MNDYEKLKNWRHNTKKILVDALGGCCNRCGYKNCHAALDFHHLDGSTKDGNISHLLSRPVKTEIIINEAKKCCLLCSNCHKEYHYGIWKIEEIQLYNFDESSFPWYYKEEPLTCKNCQLQVERKFEKQKFCSIDCASQHNQSSKSKIPPKEVLEQLLWTIPSTEIAKIYKVSDKSVFKWAKKYELDKPPRGYWQILKSAA